ncbi:MAG: LD-carboxypeptidase [Verrucomicrobiae bacterium]|nr:LD-carboxypeptidase [Verrucomicrobiae bacterium]
MLIRPKRLSPGDTLGIVAPASAPPDPACIDRAVAVLERLGFRTRLAPRVRQRRGYLAGTDRERASDLMRMFTDRRVQAILCVRGGYGTARLLPLLDYRVIREHAKILVGYSDITSLHCALFTQAKMISFHGPMLNSDFVQHAMPKFTLQSFLRTLTQASAPGGISRGYRRKTVRVLQRGVAHGQLIGGNLSLLCTTLGTPWQPPFRGRILFLEDVGEAPYRFDRMFTQLLNCGLLQQVAGVAIGLNANCRDPQAACTKEYRQTLEDVLKERLLRLRVPVLTGLPFGHLPHNATLPVGIPATLDGNRGELFLDEPAVR